MSAFEINVTPSRLRKKKRLEGREPTVVVMAPFSAKAIVQFEDVPISKTAKRILRVLNTSDEDIEVKVSRPIKQEHHLCIQWLQHTIPRCDEVSMELVWNPQNETACKETLQLLDNRNFRKDVVVILKSKHNQPEKLARKFPTIGKKLQLKSPTGNRKSQKSVTSTMSKKESIITHARATVYKSALHIGTSTVSQSPLIERNIFKSALVNPAIQTQHEQPVAQSHLLPLSICSKENVSPVQPSNVLSIIEKMKFTPLADKKPVATSTAFIDNLKAWPTPTLERNIARQVDSNDICPRSLNPALAEEIMDVSCLLASQMATNKTFDIKISDSINLSVDTLHSKKDEIVMHTANETLNQTTTILNAPESQVLSCISEEEDIQAANNYMVIKAHPETRAHDMKKDIQLVGSPLRKYSESMKNLNLLSPQNKIAIQGSMPNLNEMLPLRSIEQNRYYENHQISNDLMHRKMPFLNSSSSSEVSILLHHDVQFNQYEILAQSSRFNLHEVGSKTKPINHALQSIKRRSCELSLSDATSNETLHRSETIIISPPKKQRFDVVINTPINSLRPGIRSWPHPQSKKIKMPQGFDKKPMATINAKEQKIHTEKLYDTALFLQSCINLDPFAASTTADPFLAATIYLDERSVERHQIDFKKWLNALVSIPADLNADCNNKIDFGKLFNEVRNKEFSLAPTKEVQSMTYLTNIRLESLRRAAVELFLSEPMRLPCSKVAVYIQKQAIRIRLDRNLHLDVVMQRSMLELLLCFNPLWLRLGLEVIFGEKIHLQSNRDIVGLSTFILNRLFRNKSDVSRFSKAFMLTEQYSEAIKKHTLQKVLFLLLFLDQAKQLRIVKHNPCLFVKTSPYKETKDILLRFSSELLANVGDISRELRRLGYVLQHKQTYLDEFDYAFNNLAVDLRDGVRLARVMEIILLREDLTKQLRVPAISRLQRIYNVKLALQALSDANFQLAGNISAADVVDGHKEKTLSLLWQLCYMFRSPKFHAAARVVQLWWRRRWLSVIIYRRICYKKHMIIELATIRIQAVFRGHQTRKNLKLYKETRLLAAIVLQKHTRKFLAQKHFFYVYNCILRIQAWWRAQQLGSSCRQNFQQLQNSVLFLQRTWRRRIFVRQLQSAMRSERLQREQKHQASAICIQIYWRAHCLSQRERQLFIQKRNAVILLQQRLRSRWLMHHCRREYKQMQRSALLIQQRFRAHQKMLQEKRAYAKYRQCVVKLQVHWRATLYMRQALKFYQKLKFNTIVVQRRWRARLHMQQLRMNYLKLKQCVTLLQQRYRGRLAMLKIQSIYFKDRKCVIRLQQRWRAILEMRRQHIFYLKLKFYTSVIQRKIRTRWQMHRECQAFKQLKCAVIHVQQRWRARILMRQLRADYQRLRNVAIYIQRCFHALKAMRHHRKEYLAIQKAISCLQIHWRSYLQATEQRQMYISLRRATITLQQRFRAKKSMRKERNTYIQLRVAVVQVQRRFRAQVEMRKLSGVYQYQLEIIVRIQRHFRSRLSIKESRSQFQQMRRAVLNIQRWWRELQKMRRIRKDFQRIQWASLLLQKKWRATLLARRQRENYVHMVQQVCFLQQRLRLLIQMWHQRRQFKSFRQSAIDLQRRYRAHRIMNVTRTKYQRLRSTVIWMQLKFRAKKNMQQLRAEFLKIRNITVRLQQKFRGKRLRVTFQHLRSSTLFFQSHVRGFLARKYVHTLMTPVMKEHLNQKRAALVIQRYWRGYRSRCHLRNAGLQLIRQRLTKLRQRSEGMKTVRAKVQELVRVLRGRFVASEALAALNHLDRLSRTVPHLMTCCSEFLSSFCYGIMAQAIRSEVDKQLIERCSRIILNLTRYNCNTFQESGLVTIAQMLLRWCDKDSDIFNTLCTLIWIFSHCPNKRKIIHNYMTNTEAIYMVRETKKLVARKDKMKQNVRKAICGRHHQIENFMTAMPQVDPDFGFIRRNPYIFISSVFAFETILSKLEINLF